MLVVEGVVGEGVVGEGSAAPLSFMRVAIPWFDLRSDIL